MRQNRVFGIEIAIYKATHFPSSPVSVKNMGEENKAMKIFRQLIFTSLAVIGLSMAVSAQKDGPKRPPPKNPPPKIEPAPKNEPPRDKGPKKPGMDFVLVIDRTREELT